MLAVALAVSAATADLPHNILDYGAIPNTNTLEAAIANSRAFQSAILAANATTIDPSWLAPIYPLFPTALQIQQSRTVLIPHNYTFYLISVSLSNLLAVAIQFDGTLIANNNYTYWQSEISPFPAGVLAFTQSNYIALTSTQGGTFNGQGYDWWNQVIFTGHDQRPDLFYCHQCSNVLIENFTGRNSPQFHFNVNDGLNVIARNQTVMVDVEAQKSLLMSAGHWDIEASLPTFPLNTDGFDFSVQNAIYDNLYIENYDDAIAVKPCHSGYKFCTCSSNQYASNLRIKFSVGATIGSVPPNSGVNCVRNITFENVHMENPFKGIYIKSNPGTTGSGIIDQITYKNMTIDWALWYPVWIGPQQQQQPKDPHGGSADTGCSFFYPLNRTCATNPLITMQNIKLQDIKITNTLLLPGVILCDPANPCKNIVFDNVSSEGGLELVQKTWECHNVEGTITGGTNNPSCFTTSKTTPLL